MADIIDPSLTTEFVWPTGKPHISFSELSNWMECPYRHRLLYIDKVGSFDVTPHLSFGTAVHDANENYLKTRTMDKTIAYSVIEKSWQENADKFTNGPFPSWASKGFGRIEDWLGKASKVMDDVPGYLDKEFPGWECFGAEEDLYESVPNHRIKFKGFVDAILTVKDKGGKPKYWIIDWKTCGWGWAAEKQQDFKTQLQLILYKNFWSRKHNIDMKDIRCAFALLKRDADPGESVGLVRVSVGDITSARGMDVIDRHVKAVSKGTFIKNRNSCYFCEFQNTVHCKPNL